jgi:hypothetical protein
MSSVRPLRHGPAALGILLLAAGLAACQPKQEPTAGQTPPRESTASDSVLSISGTVHHSELEGGFWLIRGDDGAAYDPMNGLPEEFRQEGLKVRARLRPRPDMVGIHQVGTIVEIVEIRKQ